jgi:predicted peptidase
MKQSLPLLVLLIVFVLSCKEEEDAEFVSNENAPSWVGEYPQVAYGATTADLSLETDRDAKVYYILSDKPLNYTVAELKKYALAPANSAIKSSGVLDASGNQITKKTIQNLNQQTRYYTYFLAQNKADTISQTTVLSKDFATHSRQDTLEFQSSAENRKVKYLLYRPEEVLKYPEKVYPILYFLGGNGEVASNEKPINLIRNGSLPEYIYKGNDVPMIVFSIQHVLPNWNVSMINEAIDFGNKTYPVDTKKVYLTGISGGGFGCWYYAQTFPEKLTAIVPISGGGSLNKACTLKDVNIWAFHNQVDNVVASSNTTELISAVKKCPASKEVKALLFTDTGHNCWRRVFDPNHADWSKSPTVAKFDIYEWLLSKSK